MKMQKNLIIGDDQADVNRRPSSRCIEAVPIASKITRSIDCDVFICSKWNEQTFARVRVLGWNGEFIQLRGIF